MYFFFPSLDLPISHLVVVLSHISSDWQGNRNPFIDYPELASFYHGGPRPLIGEGLGYDCTIPPPPAPPTGPGVCSDNMQSCSSTDDCLCSASLFRRHLRGKISSIEVHDNKQQKSSRKLVMNSSKLIISGVVDGPLSGGLPKAVELYAIDSIADLSSYAIGSANNGPSDGPEYSLSGSISGECMNCYGFKCPSSSVHNNIVLTLFACGLQLETF